MGGDRTDLRTAAVDAEAAHAASDAAVVLPERWRLAGLLGSGGQATVWLAEDRVLGQRVALKILRAGADERTRARWLEEVRQGRRLSHPNLIRIFDVIEASERPVAVMEYLPGGTLADRVKQEGAQPVDDVVRWARDVLEVLGYLHGQRIVHRDVKPSNLLVAGDGSIKLSDLGLVRALDRASDLTATMEGVGTPRFMAPEQLRGEPPTAACDLYSLGVTMYQLLTGCLPFDGDSAFQIADGHLHADPAPVREHRPECPRWLARFVVRLLEKDPRARYPSAAEAAVALEGRRVGLPRRVWRRVAAAVVAAAAVVGGTALLVTADGGKLDRVEIDQDAVIARDGRGRPLWSAERPGLVAEVEVADLTGDREAEVAVGWSRGGVEPVPGGGVLLELYGSGGELLRSSEIGGDGYTPFSGITSDWYLRSLATGNLLGRGPELIWTAFNPLSYPSMIGATSFRNAKEQRIVSVFNSGHVQSLTVADLDDDGRDEIIGEAFNNPLGFQRVLIIAGGVSRTTGEPCGGVYSPDLNAQRLARPDQVTGCFSFTPLGSDLLILEPPKITDVGIELIVNGEVRRFDTWGNPESSPLFGAGGRAREVFWEDLTEGCVRMRVSSTVEPPFTIDQLRADHPEVLSERPVEVAAILLAARALAAGGHRSNAIALLRDGADRFPEERDLQLRLGEQLLIGGERGEGRRRVEASVSIASTARAYTDQAQLLILDAAVHGDVVTYEETRRYLESLTGFLESNTTGFLDAVWLFFQGRWTDARLVDADLGPVILWDRFIRAWARFEADQDVQAAVAGVRELEGWSELKAVARLLEARVRLAEGDPTTADQLADGGLRDLEAACRLSFEACVWAPLAEWVRGRALIEQGRIDEGRQLLELAAEHAPNTWIAASAKP